VLLYDNLKSAVLERQGDAIRFHPTLLEFAACLIVSIHARWRWREGMKKAAWSGRSAVCPRQLLRRP
jgi:hypothetical protein